MDSFSFANTINREGALFPRVASTLKTRMNQTSHTKRSTSKTLPQSEIFSLMIEARGGDKEAFERIYEHFFTPIFRFIFSKVSDRDTAEDLTQNVFIRVFESLPRFKARYELSPSAYFFTIARNQVIDFFRKDKHKLGHDDIADHEDFIASSEKPALVQIQQKQEREVIESALKKLKPEHANIIRLKFLDGFSTTEIAQKLNLTEANIRQIQVRALRKLRANLNFVFEK
jgi:RNA polymerase sigma-70 factor (ECF subfamily)